MKLSSASSPSRSEARNVRLMSGMSRVISRAIGLVPMSSCEFSEALFDLLDRFLKIIYRDSVVVAKVSGRAAQAARGYHDLCVLHQVIHQVHISPDQLASRSFTPEVMLDVPEKEIGRLRSNVRSVRNGIQQLDGLRPPDLQRLNYLRDDLVSGFERSQRPVLQEFIDSRGGVILFL